MKLKSYTLILLAAAMLLNGCTVYQGHYAADKVAGWSSRDVAGLNNFYFPTKHTPNWWVSLDSNEIGKLFVGISSDTYDPAKIWKPNYIIFSGNPIRIIVHDDNNQEMTVPADGFQTIEGRVLYLGNSRDFTVILPSFKIGDNVVPELSVHLHWSDEKYRVWSSELM